MRPVLLWALLVAAAARVPASASDAVLSTVAGSGAPGVSDGPAASATFLMPYGVAIAPDRTVYVSDYSGQRIRSIAPDGTVRTAAGGGALTFGGLDVSGAYADGPAPAARFNGPAGIALDARGRLFIADSQNRCIRVLEDGTVTTYAGAPGRNASDGTVANAGFFDPRALAFDRAGNLWVGDGSVGLRRIAPDGTVRTVVLPAIPLEEIAFGLHVTSIAANADGSLVLSDGMSIMDFDPANPATYYFTVPQLEGDFAPPHLWYPAGRSPAGYPFGVALLGPNSIVYSDPVLHAIRLRRPRLNFALTRTPVENDDVGGGGFADGALGLVDAPLGIAAAGPESAVFADAGNRRVRAISGIDLRGFTDEPQSIAPFPEDPSGAKSFRILFIGNSLLATRVTFERSAGGLVEAQLNAHRAELHLPKPARVALVGLASGAAVRDYVRDVVSAGIADAVVWEFNPGFPNSEARVDVHASPVEHEASWRPLLEAEVRELHGMLADAKIPFYVAGIPSAYDLPPQEDTWTRLIYANTPDERKYVGDEAAFARLFAAEGSRYLDLWPAFFQAESRPDRRPLFSTSDFHLTTFGQELIAGAIFRELAADPPWLAR